MWSSTEANITVSEAGGGQTMKCTLTVMYPENMSFISVATTTHPYLATTFLGEAISYELGFFFLSVFLNYIYF